jgi:type II secretory pathway component PulF
VRRAMYFEPFERALLAMGEESGKLENVLTHLADFHTRQYRLILKVKQWLAYPMFVSLVAVVLLPLPLVFQGRVSAYWTSVISGLIAWFFLGGVLLARLAQRFQQRPAYVRARFARTLAMCIAAGLALPRAALLAAGAAGHEALIGHVRAVGERRLGEQPLSVSLAGAPTLTPDFHGALLVAEKTGDYATTVGRLADLYEDGFR